MNIDKFKQQHVDIIKCISDLRELSRSGVGDNAEKISQLIISMSSMIRLHLAVEDNTLYPALKASSNSSLARMGERFQDEMGSIASAYLSFARRWNTAANLRENPDEFRADANNVLKLLFDRMRQEDTEFYPAIEAL